MCVFFQQILKMCFNIYTVLYTIAQYMTCVYMIWTENDFKSVSDPE